MELQTPKNGVIGTDMPVRDAALKVTGQFKYVGDMTLPHMLHAKVLFSPVAHARIKSIDTSQAEQLEGVRAVAGRMRRMPCSTAAARRLTERKRSGYLTAPCAMWETKWQPWQPTQQR